MNREEGDATFRSTEPIKNTTRKLQTTVKEPNEEVRLSEASLPVPKGQLRHMLPFLDQPIELTQNDFENVCFVCSEYRSKDFLYIGECNHIVCLRCCKLFSEDRIENGLNPKCPIFSCNLLFPSKFLSKILSSEHEKRLKRNEKIEQPDPKEISAVKDKTVGRLCHAKTLDELNKFKDQVCPSCSEKALFGKISQKFVKCLNCEKKFCKFCVKDYSERHFKVTSFNYCKIVFRKKLFQYASKEQKPSVAKEFIMTLFVALAAYVLCLISPTVAAIKAMGDKPFWLVPLLALLYVALFPLQILLWTLSFPFFPNILNLKPVT